MTKHEPINYEKWSTTRRGGVTKQIMLNFRRHNGQAWTHELWSVEYDQKRDGDLINY